MRFLRFVGAGEGVGVSIGRRSTLSGKILNTMFLEGFLLLRDPLLRVFDIFAEQLGQLLICFLLTLRQGAAATHFSRYGLQGGLVL